MAKTNDSYGILPEPKSCMMIPYIVHVSVLRVDLFLDFLGSLRTTSQKKSETKSLPTMPNCGSMAVHPRHAMAFFLINRYDGSDDTVDPTKSVQIPLNVDLMPQPPRLNL